MKYPTHAKLAHKIMNIIMNLWNVKSVHLINMSGRNIYARAVHMDNTTIPKVQNVIIAQEGGTFQLKMVNAFDVRTILSWISQL